MIPKTCKEAAFIFMEASYAAPNQITKTHYSAIAMTLNHFGNEPLPETLVNRYDWRMLLPIVITTSSG